MMRHPKVIATVASIICLSAGTAFAQETMQDGVYTVEQAQAGEALFTAKECGNCHGATMNGTPGGPGLKGVKFRIQTRGVSLTEFYHKILNDMPAADPGTLSPDQAADLTAYILQVNEFPAGETALSGENEALANILINEPK